MEELGKELGITNPEQWYKIKVKTLLKHGARGLLQTYKGSPSSLLISVYPEYHNNRFTISVIDSYLLVVDVYFLYINLISPNFIVLHADIGTTNTTRGLSWILWPRN